MARPVVLVYQEYASVTVTPDTPDLTCLIVGPAYWIKDYLDDKGDIKVASDYGTKDANNPYVPPAPATDAITVAEPPGNKTGAYLDATSVQVYFDACRVRIAEDTGTPTTGGLVATANIPHNKIDCSGATAGFKAEMAKMAAGDYVIIQDPAGGGTDLVKRILYVDATSFFIYTTTNFAAGSATLLALRVEREVNDVAVDSSFVTVTGNQIVIAGGVTTILTGETSPRTVSYAEVYIEYRSLRQDLNAVDTCSSETDVTSKLGKNDARNPLAGCVTTALANTTTPIQFFGVTSDDASGHSECLDIIEGRTDIYATVPLTVNKNILATYKTQFEQLASVSHSESTGIPQKFRMVLGAQTLPTSEVVSPADGTAYSDGQHASVDGPVSRTPIAAADPVDVFYDAAATFKTAGIRAGDVVVVVSDTAGTSRVGSYTVVQTYDEKRLQVTPALPGTNQVTGSMQYYVIRGTGTPVTGTTFTGGDVDATSKRITAPAVTGAASNVGKVLRITASGAPANVGDWLIAALNDAGPPAKWDVVDSAPALVDDTAGTAGSLVAPLMAVTVARDVTSRRAFRIIKSATAEHLTDLVRAGDTLEIPDPVTGTSFTTVFEHEVAYIPNENDIVLALGEDAEAQDPAAGDTDLTFRIDRALSKDDQVAVLVSVAQSFKSRRTVLVWPDSALIDGLVDGSKARAVSTVPEAADPQPGYYLASVIGGLTAGLPSHQGFTNLGIAGVSQVYHSTRYFSDTQLTTLSDGGWFVFVQDTPAALPYSLHQLTTDPSTLETGEYSVVKNFDFISMFFQDILEDFLGQYNLNEETLGLLQQSLNTGIDLLKLRKYAKIGAPLIDASVTSVAQSTAAADRAELYMSVKMPNPLNRIGLHLISS
jgi:hypothetical protein